MPDNDRAAKIRELKELQLKDLRRRSEFSPAEMPKDMKPKSAGQWIGETVNDWGTALNDSIPIVSPLMSGLAAGGYAVGQEVGDLFRDEKDRKSIIAHYLEGRNADIQHIKDADERSPWASGVGTLTGALAPIPLPGASVGKAVAKYGPKAVALGGAAGRIGSNAALSGSDNLLRSGDSDEALNAAGTAGLVTAGLETLPLVGKAVGKGYRKFVAGVSDDAVEHYMANAGAVNAVDRDSVVQKASNALNEVRGKGERAKQAVVDALDEAMDKSRSGLSKKSNFAYNVLDESDEMFKKGQLKSFLVKKLKDSEINGSLPDSPDISTVKKYINFIDSMDMEYMPASDVKRLIQRLDTDLQGAYKAASVPGGAAGIDERIGLDYRKFLDKKLKKAVPDYKEVMKPIAAETKALSETRGFFKGGDKTRSALEGTLKTGREDAAKALGGFEAKTGGKFLQDFKAADNLIAPYAGLSEKNMESTIKQLMGKGSKKFKEEQFRKLGKDVGQDLLAEIKNLSVKEAFEVGFTRGSRNVNLGAWSIGGMAGALKGLSSGGEGSLGFMGAAVGAVAGAVSDIVGPKVVKKWLDISLTPGFTKYQKVLTDAMHKGSKSLILTHEMLMARDKEYQRMMQGN